MLSELIGPRMNPSALISPGAPAPVMTLRVAQPTPVFGPGLVARDRLVHRLMRARDVPVALLCAPAGYGKTTTLLEWAQRDERPFAWLALDRDHDDPEHLLASVERCTEPLARRGGAFVLVLDDVHVLRSSGAAQAITALLEQPPRGAQVALASRRTPPVPLGRLRAHRRVIEVTTRDFVMTRSEAGALLELAGVELGPAEIDTLVRRTEGWPAGLYLAALSLRDQADALAAVARFGGDDRVVCDYIVDALLSELPPEQVTFLRRTSVLDRLSGPLCDAVCDDHGSARLLHELARANVLLHPLDRTDRWFRYHRLLAQMLRAQLRLREPELEPELHRRASRWLADDGDIDAAIRHAAAAADVQLAGELLWANLLRYIPQGHKATVRRWLDHFTDEQIASSPALALVTANVHLASGERDLAEHWTTTATHALRRASAGPAPRALEAGIAAMRAGIARGGVARMRDDAALACELDGDDGPWRSVDRQLEGTACHLLGERDRARALLEEGSRHGVVAAPSTNALCLAQLSLLALERDDCKQGTDLAARARSQVERFRLGDYPAMSLVLAVCALTEAQQGQIEAAKRDRDDATRLLERNIDCAPWYVAEVRIVLARATLCLTDVLAARAHLEDADVAMRAAQGIPVLRTWLDDTRAQVDAYSASAVIVPASLTTAELRILRLLPTHLSFREMGSRLYVSPNTVKTQAQAVYRKLDASSRSQAVARARTLGLLEM
jgi:LuxR family transcriptional regulator, maltose regulon positive regulatory protein